MGDGGIDLHGLERGVALFLRGLGIEGAHVVQPVAQLDEDDPDILTHGQKHFAHVLGLLVLTGGELDLAQLGDPVDLLTGGELDLAQLGDPVDQQRHVFAKGLFHRLQRGIGILDDVVQQGGHDTVGIHAQLDEQRRHVQRVGDIRLARQPHLPGMGVIGQVIGLFDEGQVVALLALLQRLFEVFKTHYIHNCAVLFSQKDRYTAERPRSARTPRSTRRQRAAPLAAGFKMPRSQSTDSASIILL